MSFSNNSEKIAKYKKRPIAEVENNSYMQCLKSVSRKTLTISCFKILPLK